MDAIIAALESKMIAEKLSVWLRGRSLTITSTSIGPTYHHSLELQN